MVHFFGEVSIDQTATGAFELRLSLPVTNGNFTATYESGGTAVCATVAGESIGITAVVSNTLISFKGVCADVTNKKYHFSGSYRYILP